MIRPFLMISSKVNNTVTPAEAGVQKVLKTLDSRLRGNDSIWGFQTSYEAVIFDWRKLLSFSLSRGFHFHSPGQSNFI